ncbi:MAG TPA: PQQ-binding-like beta-propeller repeat protein, partial [Verrucomicrobiae bacterium]|nr:PQQ-binding-like beta-propeller repeat protein [Verrucomicrobiae bacterium]
MKLRGVMAMILGLLVVLALTRFTINPTPSPILWKVSIKDITGDELAVGQDGTVYQRGFRVLRSYDVTGKLRWASPAGIWIDSAPVIGKDGTIYVRESAYGLLGVNSGVLALRSDGAVKWRFPIKNINEHDWGAAFSLDERDTIYFSVGNGFFSPKSLFAVNKEGQEVWHFDSKNNMTAPVGISGDGSVLFGSSDGTNTSLLRFDSHGSLKRLLEQKAAEMGLCLSFSQDWEGVIYVPGGKGSTMLAFEPDGSLKWCFSSSFRAYSAPTIGPDGSLFFTAANSGQEFLVALARQGQLKWKYRLGAHWNLTPPAIASDGTVFVVSSDPKVTALNPNGTVRWIFVTTQVEIEPAKGWMRSVKIFSFCTGLRIFPLSSCRRAGNRDYSGPP